MNYKLYIETHDHNKDGKYRGKVSEETKICDGSEKFSLHLNPGNANSTTELSVNEIYSKFIKNFKALIVKGFEDDEGIYIFQIITNIEKLS